MLRTRLWMGALLILMGLSLLWLDTYVEPWAPTLLATVLVAVSLGCRELVSLLPEPKPRFGVCLAGVIAVVLANWPAHLAEAFAASATVVWPPPQPWQWVAATLAATLLLLFVVEGAAFCEPGQAVRRLSIGFWIVGYGGLLASFFVQLRWLPHGPSALALAIFVPKCGDIGAYFTGRAIGKHQMAPLLSPKKTWEGAAGGMAASVAIALVINAMTKDFLSWPSAAGFGLVVGAVAMIGDLMESLIKRDCSMKDASHVVPGFGGVLDVVDSILFSAPVAYWWLTWLK